MNYLHDIINTMAYIRSMKNVKLWYIDLFCGAGGTSSGIESSYIDGKKVATVIGCVNHDKNAIASHFANHPHALHFTEDIRILDLKPLISLIKKIRVINPDAKIVLWGSLECFPKGTLILTKRGMIDISEVIIGDEVLTHKNRWRKVSSIMKKKSKTIKLKGKGFCDLETTKNHPIYIMKRNRIWNNNIRQYRWVYNSPDWERAGNIEKGKSMMASPLRIEEMPIPEIGGRGMNLSNDFWWMIGRFLGDGCVSLRDKKRNQYQICISCGDQDTDYLEKRLSVFNPKRKRAGVGEIRFYKRKVRTATLFEGFHDGLSNWILDNFGKYSHGKTLPSWIYGMRKEWKQSLLDGYKSSDGYFDKKLNQWSINTTSKKLAISMRLLAISLGYEVNIRHYDQHNNEIEGRIVNTRSQWQINWTENISKSFVVKDENHIWGSVKNIEELNEEKDVYNISVEEDESYIADGMVVHNCTNFSKAKGGLSRDPDSRTLADHLHRYIQDLNPDMIHIENVEEFMSWGDLDEGGKPIKEDKGRLYNEWVESIKLYGYYFEHHILNSADFGAYTSRKRFFGQFAKDLKLIAWPKPTHSKGGKNGLKKWNPVKEVLDLEDEGISIFGRKKPLSEKTLERIYAGLIKFVAGGKDQWLLKYNSINGKTGKHIPPSIDDPCPVISCQSRLGVVKAVFMSKHFSGHPNSKNISIDGPTGAITTVDHHSVVSSKFLAAYYSNGDNVSSISNPCPTVPTKDRFNYVSPKFMYSYNFKDAGKDINEPCPTLLTKDRLALVSPFIMNYYTGGGQLSDIEDPAPAILANPKQRLVSYQFMDQQFGNSVPSSLLNPLGCVTANPKYNLVSCRPWIMDTNFWNVGNDINRPSPTITANRKWHYLMNPQFASAGSSVDNPCFTLIARMDKKPPYIVTLKEVFDTEYIPDFVKVDQYGNIFIEIYESDSPMLVKIKEFMTIYQMIDILMRMLKITELLPIMGFSKNYKLIGTQVEKKKYIGNAVEVGISKKICGVIIESILRECC